MELSQESLMLGVTPYLLAIYGYYDNFLSALYDAFEKTNYDKGFSAEVHVSCAKNIFTYSIITSRKKVLEESEIRACLDHAISSTSVPTIELPEVFSFIVRMRSDANNCVVGIESYSLTQMIEIPAEVIARFVNRGQNFSQTKEDSIFQLSLDFAEMESNCIVLFPSTPSAPELQLANYIQTSALDYASSHDLPPETLPSGLQVCFRVNNEKLLPLIPSMSEICYAVPELLEKQRKRRDELNAPERCAQQQLELHQRRSEKYPDDLDRQLSYYLTLCSWGFVFSQDVAWDGIEHLKNSVAKNPNSANAHGKLAWALHTYAMKYHCLPTHAGEIAKHYTNARELDPIRVEDSVRTVALMFTSLKMYKEAIAEWKTDSFQKYRVPPHKLSFIYLLQIIDCYEKLGDFDSAIPLIEESIQFIKEDHPHWLQLRSRLPNRCKNLEK